MPAGGIVYSMAEPNSLANIDLTGIRPLLSRTLSYGDIGTVWFDTFGTSLQDELPKWTSNECLIELISRARKQQLLPQMLEAAGRLRPDLRQSIVTLWPAANERFVDCEQNQKIICPACKFEFPIGQIHCNQVNIAREDGNLHGHVHVYGMEEDIYLAARVTCPNCGNVFDAKLIANRVEIPPLSCPVCKQPSHMKPILQKIVEDNEFGIYQARIVVRCTVCWWLYPLIRRLTPNKSAAFV